MSMSVKIVGGIAFGAVLLAGSQLVRDREAPSWTAAARSVEVGERASTPVFSAATAVDREEGLPVPLPTPPQASRGASDRDKVRVRDVRVEPVRAPAPASIDASPPPSSSIQVAALQPPAETPAAVALDRGEDVEPNRGAAAEPARPARLRPSGPRRASLRFARSGRCGARCSASASLPNRYNPIQFRLADRGGQ